MTRSLNLILITYLKSLKGTLRGSTHKHAVTSSNCIITESKFEPSSALDSPCQNFNYTGTVVFGCLVQTPQLQCEAKRPTAVKFHPGLLQFRPKHTHSPHSTLKFPAHIRHNQIQIHPANLFCHVSHVHWHEAWAWSLMSSILDAVALQTWPAPSHPTIVPRHLHHADWLRHRAATQ